MSRGPAARSRWSGAELFGILLVLVGVVFLLRNSGIVTIGGTAIGALVLVVIGVYFLATALLPRGATRSSVAIPREAATHLDLDLGVGAGTFVIGGGARDLVEVESGEDDVSVELDRSGARTRVRVRQRLEWFPFGRRSGYRWQVRIAEDVPTALVLAAGAGDFALDLSRLQIVDARISAGAAHVNLVLPRPRGEVRVSISAGAASFTVQVPPGVEARVTATGLMSLEGRNETPGFASATDRVVVAASGGAASLKIV